jgi:branched-chain amino acid transport system permease protein
LQLLIDGCANGLVFALVALGYTMVYGIVELINFAHGTVVMLGAFLALTLIGLCGPAASWPVLLLLVPACAVFCAGVAWGVDRVAYAPLRHAPKLTVLVTALGCAFVLMNLGLLWGGLPMEIFGGGRAPSSPKSVPDLLPVGNLLGETATVWIGAREVVVAALTLPLMALLTWFVRCTRLGTAMRACAQNPVAARLMGIDADAVISTTFAIGGALAGVAAVAYAIYNGTVHFQMGYTLGLMAFTSAVLGGIGNLPGAVLGGVCIGLTQSFTVQFLSGDWTNVVVFVVLIAVLVLRPQGLLGARVREKV